MQISGREIHRNNQVVDLRTLVTLAVRYCGTMSFLLNPSRLGATITNTTSSACASHLQITAASIETRRRQNAHGDLAVVAPVPVGTTALPVFQASAAILALDHVARLLHLAPFAACTRRTLAMRLQAIVQPTVAAHVAHVTPTRRSVAVLDVARLCRG